MQPPAGSRVQKVEEKVSEPSKEDKKAQDLKKQKIAAVKDRSSSQSAEVKAEKPKR